MQRHSGESISTAFRTSLHGINQSLDFRPLEFAEPLPSTWTCALCHVAPRSSVILQCHVFCVPCYEEIVRRGCAKCPLDSTTFRKDGVICFEIPVSQLMERSVRCWNSLRGCSFSGPLGTLLAHVEDECKYVSIHCRKCEREVLRSNALDHALEGCDVPKEPVSPNRSCSDQDICVTRIAMDIRREGKHLDENLASVIHNQNDVRETVSALKLTTETHAAEVKDMLQRQTEMTGQMEFHLSSEFALLKLELDRIQQRLSGIEQLRCDLNEVLSTHQLNSVTVLWQIKYFNENKQEATERGSLMLRSDIFDVGGYHLRLVSCWTFVDGVLTFQIYLALCSGPNDSRLSWPFTKPFTLALVHPKDKTKSKKVRFDPLRHQGSSRSPFMRPRAVENPGAGVKNFYKVNDLKSHGFVQDNALCVSGEIETFASGARVDGGCAATGDLQVG
ncbi:TNF receptor-associated factor 3-like [Ornithodoros turicata]|uniref:TNF receptor-associated factor 3-like n=1 Tax=Ornithodoros turicata TaxID=34597 RepID=UPI0031395503